jgi:hypothetical protein
VLKQGKVEKRIERESDDIEVLVIGQFLIRSGCRRELISLYIDVKGVGCREINTVDYN